MLQVALLLFGCPLSRYLREIDTAVVSVVLGFTFFGMISYLLIIVKGATFGSFPYQTPVSHALRHLGHSALSLIPSISRTFSQSPMPIARFITSDVWLRLPPLSALDTLPPLAIAPDAPLLLAVTLNDLSPFLVALWPIFTPPIENYYQYRASIRLLVLSIRRAPGAFSTPEQGLDQQTIALELRCITWMLQTSLDKAVRLSALKYLVTMALAEFDPKLIAACFSTFTGCINVRGRKVVITRIGGARDSIRHVFSPYLPPSLGHKSSF